MVPMVSIGIGSLQKFFVKYLHFPIWLHVWENKIQMEKKVCVMLWQLILVY